MIPFFSARHVEAAVTPEARLRRRSRRVRGARARRVDDAAEAVRHELPGRRLPRDAGARRWPCPAEVGHIVSGQSRARTADRERARHPLGRRDRPRRGGPGRGLGDRSSHRGGRGAGGRDAGGVGWGRVRDRRRRERARRGSNVQGARPSTSCSGTSTRNGRGRWRPISASASPGASSEALGCGRRRHGDARPDDPDSGGLAASRASTSA